MQFSIERHEDNGFSFLRMTDKSNNTWVSVSPEYGALLHEFSISINGVPYNIIENYPDIEALKKDIGRFYKGAKLSPFVCRINKASYEYGGTQYTFSNTFPDGSAIHGLLYDKPFQVAEQFVNENNACITLVYDYNGEDPGYPFKYRCKVTYTLMPDNILQVSTNIKNQSEINIPIADGWHPYFKLQGKLDEWVLKIRSAQQLEFDEYLIPTGRFLTDERFVNGASMEGITLDNCFLLEETHGDPLICELMNPDTGLRLQLYADSGYPYLQVYTPDDRNSIAIENLSGAPDCFNNSLGLLKLNPGDSTTFGLHYKINQEKRVP